jgi:hypothetical protein
MWVGSYIDLIHHVYPHPPLPSPSRRKSGQVFGQQTNVLDKSLCLLDIEYICSTRT